MEEIRLGRKKVYVAKTGSKILGVLEWVFHLSAVVLLIVALVNLDSIWTDIDPAIYFGLAIGTFLSGLLINPLKAIVKASEYYIAQFEDSHEPTSDKSFMPEQREQEQQRQG